MARAGMVNIIQELRSITNAGTADYTSGTVSYFTDDQLQMLLDRTQFITRLAPLRPIPVRNGNLTQWYDYEIPEQLGVWFEENATTGAWAVKDGTGNTMAYSTDYTVNYQSHIVTFANDTKGSAYLLDCKAYDLYAAAAFCFRQKAGFEARAVDFSSDNHSVKASQRRDYCIKMAEYYEQKAGVSGDGGITVGRLVRSDEDNRPAHYGATDLPLYSPQPGGWDT